MIEESSSNESTSSSSQPSCDCVENCLYQIKQVNMISSESNFLIEIVENIPDKELQREYFKKYFLQNNLDKTHRFYEFILVDSESVEISHIQNETSIEICYSKCKIFKVLTHKSWGQSSDTHKSFSENFRPKSYDYHNYIDAWFYTFFYRPFDHLWFFHWGDEIKNQNDFPNWF